MRIAELDLAPGKYHLVVARFEPENHVLEAVQGYVASRAELPLVVVGSAPYADDYTAAVEAAAPTTGCDCSAGFGTRSCWTSCTRTRSPTCTDTPWVAPTRRCCGQRARGRTRWPSTSRSTAR